MAYEMKDNTGSLFRNDKREKDTQPNAKGKAMIGGVMYYVSAWTKPTKDGEKWQSLAFTPIDGESSAPRPKAKPAKDEFEDAPF